MDRENQKDFNESPSRSSSEFDRKSEGCVLADSAVLGTDKSKVSIRSNFEGLDTGSKEVNVVTFCILILS